MSQISVRCPHRSTLRELKIDCFVGARTAETSGASRSVGDVRAGPLLWDKVVGRSFRNMLSQWPARRFPLVGNRSVGVKHATIAHFLMCLIVFSVLKDSTGVSNLFVLDLCDTANTQDPRDGRTSLMTAVLDNNEVRVHKIGCGVYWRFLATHRFFFLTIGLQILQIQYVARSCTIFVLKKLEKE